MSKALRFVIFLYFFFSNVLVSVVLSETKLAKVYLAIMSCIIFYR